MDQALLNEEQSRSLAISFIQKLAEEFANEFTKEGLANLLKSLECFLYDPLYPEVWRETYEGVFGQSFIPETLLTKEEVFTNLIEFCVRFIYDWGIDLSETVRVLFKIRFYRESCFLELNRYREFLNNVPVQQKRASPTPISVFKTADVKPSISIHQNNQNRYLGYARVLIPLYLDRLWHDRKSYFSDEGFDEFTDYISILTSDSAFEGQLEDVYPTVFGKTYSSDDKISTDGIFTLMIHHCAYFAFGFQFGCRELLNYLFLIRHKPQHYQYENEIWTEELNKLVFKYDH